MSPRKPPLVIGIAGPHGAGKNTLADYLTANRPGSHVWAFTDPLRAMLEAGLGVPADAPKHELLPDINRSPRELLRSLGDWARTVHPYTLLFKMRDRIDAEPGARLIVVPDVYTEHEAGFIRKRGVVVHLKGRAKHSREHITAEQLRTDHVHDYVVQNDGTLTALEAEACDLARTLGLGSTVGGCRKYCSGSQWHCAPCGTVWDMDDPEPPPCAAERISYPVSPVK